jgi:hypothetical protein
MDMEAALVPAMQAAFTARVLTSTPDNLELVLPVIKLLDTGGTGDWQRFETTGVEVDIFHDSKADASALAWQAYRWFMEEMPPALGTVGVRRVNDSTLPVETSYQNPNVWRYTFNVTIETHDRRL